jgi:hypothetical protein
VRRAATLRIPAAPRVGLGVDVHADDAFVLDLGDVVVDAGVATV